MRKQKMVYVVEPRLPSVRFFVLHDRPQLLFVNVIARKDGTTLIVTHKRHVIVKAMIG